MLSCGQVLVKTENLVISRRRFADYSKKIYQNVKRTCRAIVLLNRAQCCVSSLPRSGPYAFRREVVFPKKMIVAK